MYKRTQHFIFDKYIEPYQNLLSAMIQQAIIDFDENLYYLKRGIKTYTRNHCEKVDTKKENDNILKFLYSPLVMENTEINISKTIELLMKKNGF